MALHSAKYAAFISAMQLPVTDKSAAYVKMLQHLGTSTPDPLPGDADLWT